MRRFFTAGDIVVIVALLAVAVVLFPGFARFSGGEPHVVIESKGRRVVELPLNGNVEYAVDGARGETVVIIRNGGAWIKESPCPHGYCKRMGTLSHRGEIAVCVPNRVIVSIHGGSDKDIGFDGVTQ